MNITVSQSDKLNINDIKNVKDIDFQDYALKPTTEKAGHLHGRKPVRIRFFANGDKFFPGKKISIYIHRYQNMDELMTELTNKMPPQVYLPNGIRQIFATSDGKKISDINQLAVGQDYVCAGNENYKNISYGNTEKEPWFKGRPHNFSRYPHLLPIGLAPNADVNNIHKFDDHSQYAGQNAFPTRFFRPAAPTYLTKNVVGAFASHGSSSISYPKLIKFKSKATMNKSVNYYRDLLNQQVKPRVITVVRSGPEKPMGFVRILLNKRSVQSFESLLTDIETSIRDHSHHKMTGIDKVYNLLGKEVNSVGDFFRNDDIFIAIGNNEALGAKQVKDILDEMYPDHPQTNLVLKYWTVKKHDEPTTANEQKETDRTKNNHGSNMTVDKRDSGFEEQNFSKESEFNSVNNNVESKDSSPLPKPKLSNSKPAIKKRKSISKTRTEPLDTPQNSETISSNNEKPKGRISPRTYQKLVQDRNTERLRAAYEERERARLQLQEQLKSEKKKLEENSINNSSVYSQMIRKSINERGSIDIFKRMDDASQEARRQKMREMRDRQHNFDSKDSASSSLVSSQANSLEQKEIRELPSIEILPQSNVNNAVTPKLKHSNYDIGPPVGKLNKINEDPAEQNGENVEVPSNDDKVSNDKIIKSQMDSEPKPIRKKMRRPFQENNFAKQDNNNKISDATDFSDYPNNIETKSTERIEIDKEKEKETIMQTPKKVLDDNKVNQKAPESDQVTKKEPSKDPISTDQSEMAKENTGPKIDINNNQIINVDISKTSEYQTITVDEKITTDKPVQSKPSLPGSRVMGKLCRQLSSSDPIYQRFEVTKLLGDGNFAIVKLAIHKKSKTEYALKIIDKARMVGKESMIENEIWIMKLCNHENIVKLKEEYETKEEVFLIMELVKSGDLFDAITQNVKFNEPVAARMVSDMSNALFYLHSRRIVHRDLKPENLMVLRHKDGSITLKLADFGLAMEIKKLIYTVCGTPTYVAPEILTEKGYSLEVDLWALGVITYILLCGFPPFRSPNRDQDQLFEIIKSGSFEFISPYWDKISMEVKDLIKRLLIVDRKMRFTTIDVLSHKWLLARGKPGTQVTVDFQKQKMSELEEQAKTNLEGFQKQKKDLRSSINREIQAAYQIQKK